MKKLFVLFFLVFPFILLEGAVLAKENVMVNLNDIDNLDVDKSDVVSINFINSLNIPDDAIFIRDISTSQNQSIKMYYIYDEAKDCYDMNICSSGIIKLTSCESLFKDYDEVKCINGLELIDTSNVTSMKNMFYNCYHLKELDLSYFNTDNVTDMSGMFGLCSSLKELNLNSFDTSKVIDFSSFLYYCKSLESIDFDKITTNNCTVMNEMFYGMEKISIFDLSGFDTSKVHYMQNVFGCVTTDEIILNGWDFRCVYNMEWRNFFGSGSSFKRISFNNCMFGTTMEDLVSHHGEIEQISFENVDTSLVSNMDSLFYSCGKIEELDLSSFDTSNVTNMSSMFRGCGSLKKINLNSFNTKNVLDMSQMFASCISLISLDLSSFNTRKVLNMRSMLAGCRNLKYVNISNFDMDKLSSDSSSNAIADYGTYGIGLFYLKRIDDIDDARLKIYQNTYNYSITIYVLDEKTKELLIESQKLTGNVSVAVLPSEPTILHLYQEVPFWNNEYYSEPVIIEPIYGGDLKIDYLVNGEYTDKKPNDIGKYKVKISLSNDFYWQDFEKEVTLNIWKKGNFNNDNIVNIIDVRILLQKVIANKTSNWTETELTVGDMNKDGVINIIDVRVLLQKVIGES